MRLGDCRSLLQNSHTGMGWSWRHSGLQKFPRLLPQFSQDPGNILHIKGSRHGHLGLLIDLRRKATGNRFQTKMAMDWRKITLRRWWALHHGYVWAELGPALGKVLHSSIVMVIVYCHWLSPSLASWLDCETPSVYDPVVHNPGTFSPRWHLAKTRDSFGCQSSGWGWRGAVGT